MKLEDIWSIYRNNLKVFLHKKISNFADVDDILQDVLIKIHTNISNLRDERSIKSWLFQITNRAVIDFYRKQGRANEINEETLWYNDTNRNVKSELLLCIEPFLNSLSEDSADLIRIIDLQNIPQKTYAEQSDISYSTVKSRVKKARIEMKKLFDTCCDFSLDKQGNLVEFQAKNNNCGNC
jgi:RNA polymerase sigma-70 factor (ECF subfamily)